MLEPLSKGSLWQEQAVASTMLEMMVCTIFMIEHANADAIQSVCVQVLMSLGTLLCGAVSPKHALLLAPIIVLLDWMRSRSHTLCAFSEFWDSFVEMYNRLPRSTLTSSVETTSLPLQEELELIGFSHIHLVENPLTNAKDLDVLSSLGEVRTGLGSISHEHLTPGSPQEQRVLDMTYALVLFTNFHL